jgi:hypothetical protein
VRILFFETDATTSEVRLKPLLDQLVRTGEIEDYAVVDRDMSVGPKKLAHYDVALTHRAPNSRQLEWLRRHRPPLVYDIDDLLLKPGDPDPVRRGREEGERVDWCLRHADIVTSPSPRLLAVLGERCGEALRGRAHLLPSCGRETPVALRTPGRPSLLWVSSSAHRWTDELCAVANGIEAAARELRIDIHLVGRFPPALTRVLSKANHRQDWIPFPRFMDLLAANPYVAVVPLDCGLAAGEQAFLDCKSDIKAAQYGSSRIAAAFSPAAPYRESELPCRLVPANTAEAWRNAAGTLFEGFPASGNQIGDDQAFLARRPSVVATTLRGLLEAARQPSRPAFSFRTIPTPRLGRYMEQRIRAARARFLSRQPHG